MHDNIFVYSYSNIPTDIDENINITKAKEIVGKVFMIRKTIEKNSCFSGCFFYDKLCPCIENKLNDYICDKYNIHFIDITHLL